MYSKFKKKLIIFFSLIVLISIDNVEAKGFNIGKSISKGVNAVKKGIDSVKNMMGALGGPIKEIKMLLTGLKEPEKFINKFHDDTKEITKKITETRAIAFQPNVAEKDIKTSFQTLNELANKQLDLNEDFEFSNTCASLKILNTLCSTPPFMLLKTTVPPVFILCLKASSLNKKYLQYQKFGDIIAKSAISCTDTLLQRLELIAIINAKK